MRVYARTVRGRAETGAHLPETAGIPAGAELRPAGAAERRTELGEAKVENRPGAKAGGFGKIAPG